MAVLAFAYRVTPNLSKSGELLAEADVRHATTDTQANVEAAALAYCKKFSDLRGKTITWVSTSLAHTVVDSSTRISTVKYRFN